MKSIVFTVINDLSHDRRMQRICGSLAKNGYDVTLVGRALSDSKALPQFAFSTIRLKCFFNKGKLFYIEYNWRLFWKLLFLRADIYGAVDLDTIVPCFKAAWLKGKKKTFDAHEYFEEVPEVAHRPFTKAVWKLVGRFFVPSANLALTVSESLVQQFQNLYGIRFELIRNVPWKSQEPLKNFPGDYLLYQGALNEGRGLEQLLEAMQSIEMRLKIAGEGDLSAALRKKAAELNLRDKVEFLGFLAPDKLEALTANAWLGLNLLEGKGLNYQYSLANKFFDYINHGVPSLNRNFTEYSKINEQYKVGILLKELSAQEIIDAVRLLKTNPALYEELRNNCLAAREEFNWEKEERKLLNLYARLG